MCFHSYVDAIKDALKVENESSKETGREGWSG
jgi:hypothetical protein